jgi:hypothetical protein
VGCRVWGVGRINKSNIDHSAAHFVLFVKKTFSLQQNYTIN